MRIDFLITELFVGGAERCLTELVCGLAASGDRVRVYSIGSLPTGQQRALVERIEAAGIEIRSCEADSVFQFAAAYRQLRHWLRRDPPDLCQTFLFHANVLGTMAGKSAGVARRLGGIRVVDDRWHRRQAMRIVTPHMNRVVCVSGAVERFALQQLGCQEGQTVTIPNGVDADRFATAPQIQWSSFGWPDDAKVALYVGRLSPQKGIELLKQQVDAIAPANSDRRLLIVGDGPQRDSLATWAANVGSDRVQLLPWQADVAPLMRACRLLVLPSKYEGMPNVVLEAMAAGRPVVCSDIQGSEELFSHARDRQVFRSGHGDELKNLVERFMSDEALSEKIGQDNRRRVSEEFSIATMVDRYRTLYQTLRSDPTEGGSLGD